MMQSSSSNNIHSDLFFAVTVPFIDYLSISVLLNNIFNFYFALMFYEHTVDQIINRNILYNSALSNQTNTIILLLFCSRGTQLPPGIVLTVSPL